MQHDFSYWNGCATILDELYDHLPDANQEIGSEALGNTVKHPRLVLSLEKTYNSELPQIFTGHDLIMQPKYDGIAAVVHYENGKLKYCLSRGDGRQGNNLTFQALRSVKNLPMSIPVKESVVIRGEIVLPTTLPTTNDRNITSGIMHAKNDQDKAGLDFVAFDAWQGEFDKIATESDLIGRLEALNFCVARTINNPDERKQVPYATDGVVYKINNRAKQKALGATKYAPKILDKGDQRQKKLGKGEKLKKNQKKLNFFKIYRYAIYSVYPHINWCDEFLHISIIYKRLFGKYDMYMNTQ